MEETKLKYIQLLCISFFIGNNVNCEQLLIDPDEFTNLKISACVAECLYHEIADSLTDCYQQCANRTDSLSDVRSEPLRNAWFGLHCRDSEKLLIQVDGGSGQTENEKNIYLVTIQEATNPFAERLVYISDVSLIELPYLKSSESYNVSVSVLSSKYEYSDLGTQQHSTLLEDFTPETVTEVMADEFHSIEGDGEHLRVMVRWKPTRSKTCFYEVWLYMHDNDMGTTEKKEHNLYYHEYKNLAYDTNYYLNIRGCNVAKKNYSPSLWHSFKTPNCWDLTKPGDFCGPLKIKGFKVEITAVKGDLFVINITWNKPWKLPERYKLEIHDVNATMDGNGMEGYYEYQLHRNATSFYHANTTIKGHECEFLLTVYQNNLYAFAYKYIKVPHIKYQGLPHDKSFPFYNYALILVTVAVLLVIFYIIKP